MNMNSSPEEITCHPDRSEAIASEVEGPAFLRLDLHSRSRLAVGIFVILLIFSSSCHSEKSQLSAAKRYPFKGKVISIDKNAASANVDNEPIPNYMDSMVMPYPIKPSAMLSQLQPGDTITADVVVQPDNTYWLENVKVVGHAPEPPAKSASSAHFPSPGDPVPDFKLINQNGKAISLNHYRGETLVLTFIYTRCPFPDFCPRVIHEFAAINEQLRADPARYGKTHLLSISFDPAHDTPKVLRDYGFSNANTKDPALFSRWEFAVIPSAELPTFAEYFALTYKEENGMITHSLSTAIISADGKIFKWYHGADWQAADLLQDIAAAHAAS